MSSQDDNPFTSTSASVPLSFQDGGYVPSVEGNMERGSSGAGGLDDDAFGAPADQRVLLDEGAGGASKPGLLSLERYQVYFNVDTKDVLRRIYDSVFIPGDGVGFLEKTTHQPDFYGPFWICTTLIFVTAAGAAPVSRARRRGGSRSGGLSDVDEAYKACRAWVCGQAPGMDCDR